MEQVIQIHGKKAENPLPLSNVQEDSDDDEMNRSVGECDSDELDGDLNLSDNEEEASNLRNKIKEVKKNAERRKYKQEIDTNVFKI